MREKIRSRDYIVTYHARKEMNNDNMICDMCAIACDKCNINFCVACYSEHEC